MNTRNRLATGLATIAITITLPMGAAQATPGNTPTPTTPTAAATPSATPATQAFLGYSDTAYTYAHGNTDCPDKAPNGTLRDGSERKGAAKLCAKSAREAATPAAARAVKQAFRWLGLPYINTVDQRDDEGWFDCSSYVTRAYFETGTDTRLDGWFPNTVAIRDSAPWAVEVSAEDAKPGDLIVYYSGAGMSGHHVVMLLADGWVAHTNNTGDVSHVSRHNPDWPNATYMRVIDPHASSTSKGTGE